MALNSLDPSFSFLFHTLLFIKLLLAQFHDVFLFSLRDGCGIMSQQMKGVDVLVSTKGRYALRFLIDLAQHEAESPVPLKEISERQGISKKYLERIISQLSGSGMLQVTRGYLGGYRLGRDPELITVAEVLQLTEGGFAPVSYEEYEESDSTVWVWRSLEGAITRCLENMTLKDVLEHLPDTPDRQVSDVHS